jgi:hypothetical protein
MLPKGDAKKVTIYLNQDTRTHMEPLWSAILGFLRHKHVAGATLFRGMPDSEFMNNFTTLNPNTSRNTAPFVSSSSTLRNESMSCCRLCTTW